MLYFIALNGLFAFLEVKKQIVLQNEAHSTFVLLKKKN
jgi:hypothetical protein